MFSKYPYVEKTFNGYTLTAGIQDTENSSVYESENPIDCGKLAIKFLKKSGSSKEACLNEIDINNALDNDYIMPAKGVIYDIPPEFYCGIVMDKAAGCDLLDMFLGIDSPFDEAVAAQVAYAGLKALEYLHDNGICHRDVKPENFFLMDENLDELDIVLADFGHACHFNKGVKMNEFNIGTLIYSAPEILKKEKYDESVDIWSLGCVIYSILAACMPFPHPKDEKSIKMCTERIIRGNPDYESEPWDMISDEAKDFVQSMIQVDPEKRSSISDLLQHPWIQSNYVDYGRQRERRNRTRQTFKDISKHSPSKEMSQFYGYKPDDDDDI